MQKFEQIIQQAFAKIDASNPKMRQKVYENIWFVQEKALAEHNVSAAQKQARRENLTELLKNVEMRYRTAQPAALEPARRTPPSRSAAPAENFPEQDSGQLLSEEDFLRSETSAPQREESALGRELSYAAGESAFSDNEPIFNIEEHRREPQFSYNGAESGSNPADRRYYQDSSIGSALSAPRHGETEPDEPLFAADEPAFTAEHFTPRRTAEAAAARAEKKAARKRADDEKSDYLEHEISRKTSEKTSSRHRLRLGFYLIGGVSMLVAVLVIWSFYNSFGGRTAREQRAFGGPMQQNNYAGGGWAEVFSPTNASGLTTEGEASVNLHNEPDANFIRITAQKGNNAAILEVGQGALMNLRGKTATFKLVARSAENNIGQLSLIADFGTKAPQRRYRFELSPTAEPLLFRLDIPQHLSGPVRFYLGTDIEDGKPHETDIFSLLLRESDDKGH